MVRTGYYKGLGRGKLPKQPGVLGPNSSAEELEKRLRVLEMLVFW